jgi:O-antigen ligase
MAMNEDAAPEATGFAIERLARAAAIVLLIAVLAWSPFPLGGAVAWATAFNALLLSLAWACWAVAAAFDPEEALSGLRRIWVPVALALGVLVWAVLQATPLLPQSWAHPVWAMAKAILPESGSGTVSLNPWRTLGEVLKLATYGMAFWLAFALGRRSEGARWILHGVLAIAALYAVYTFALVILDTTQVEVIFGLPLKKQLISGPYRLHNSLATYMGMATLAALLTLLDRARETVVTSRGPRQMMLTGTQFLFGPGIVFLLATLLLFAAMMASASRGGFAATVIALLVIAIVSILADRGAQRWRMILGGGVAALPLLALLLASSDKLGQRLAVLADAGTPDDIRLALWDATLRMIQTTPWYGLGLGTFEDAYPMYALKVFPYVMDKAHCDYLEFVAGVGIPAAAVWFIMLAWLAVLCLKGTFDRRRNRMFPLLGFAATIVVAVHSSVDFSLQLPAVGILYAVLLGVGVAQSQRTRSV